VSFIFFFVLCITDSYIFCTDVAISSVRAAITSCPVLWRPLVVCYSLLPFLAYIVILIISIASPHNSLHRCIYLDPSRSPIYPITQDCFTIHLIAVLVWNALAACILHNCRGRLVQFSWFPFVFWPLSFDLGLEIFKCQLWFQLPSLTFIYP